MVCFPPTAGGGIAYVGVFGFSNLAYYSPALVYYNNLGGASRSDYIVEAASHEVGHNMGLSHDGRTDGTAYHGGTGNWGPIMGVGYGRDLSQWSKGEYPLANNLEDDLAIMQGKFGLRPDEAGATVATAASMVATGSGSFEATGVAAFVVSSGTYTPDVDVWSFQAGEAGLVTVTVTPWVAGSRTNGQNLIPLVALLNGAIGPC